MKKAKSWLALPLAVCMFAVIDFSVAEAAETSDEIRLREDKRLRSSIQII